MISQRESESLDTKIAECMRLHDCRAWFVVLGILLILAGGVAASYAVFATLTTVFLFGCLLLAGGVVQCVNAFVSQSWRGFFLHLLGGVLHVVLGGLMIERPDRAAEVLTLMLAVAFLMGGMLRVVGSLAVRFAGWGWMLVNGVVTFALGISIWRQYPESAYWVIGLFAGIDMLFNGWSWLMLGLMVKAPTKSANIPVEPKQAPEAALPIR